MTDWTFRNLQDEHAPWALHNFGKRPSWQPFISATMSRCLPCDASNLPATRP